MRVQKLNICLLVKKETGHNLLKRKDSLKLNSRRKRKKYLLLDVNTRKGEGQMKVKNLFTEKKKCANESSESGTKRLETQSQYQRQTKGSCKLRVDAGGEN